jgi:predicted lipoprotein with Yx(FWY)xxD motif
MRIRIAFAGVALLAALAACGSPQTGTASPGDAPAGNTAPGVKIGQSALGPILTDQNGRTLYAFVPDKGGPSTCQADCVASWPALTSDKDFMATDSADPKLLAEMDRPEGTHQATYGQWALYYYAGDQDPGDIDGQNVDELWFVLGADGKLIKKTM